MHIQFGKVSDKSGANGDEAKGVKIVEEAVKEIVKDAEEVLDNAGDTVDGGAV